MDLYVNQSNNNLTTEEELYKDLKQINKIYEDMTEILKVHDTKLDSIIEHMDVIKLDAEKTKKELEEAERYQNSAMWKKINLFGFLTIFGYIFK